MKGLRLTIYKQGGRSFAGPDGISAKADEVTLVGTLVRERGTTRYEEVELPPEMRVFEPSDDAPPVLLDRSHVALRLVPALAPYPPNLVGPMSGGCFAGTNDGRMAELVRSVGGYSGNLPLPLHDRYESRAQYAAITAGD